MTITASETTLELRRPRPTSRWRTAGAFFVDRMLPPLLGAFIGLVLAVVFLFFAGAAFLWWLGA